MSTDNDTNPTPLLQAVKGFNADLTCRNFQYVEGETYEQDTPARLCSTGFHAVLSPLDVFSYYPPAYSVYHTVELGDVDEKRESDSKVAGRTIKVGAALGIPGLVSAHVEFVLSNADKKKAKHSTGDRSASSATGYRSASSATGDQSASSATGDQSASSATGDQSASINTGNYGTARVQRETDGPEAVAVATGFEGSAAGSQGDWIVLTERDGKHRIVGVKAFLVDGVKVKADTFYLLRGGKAVTR